MEMLNTLTQRTSILVFYQTVWTKNSAIHSTGVTFEQAGSYKYYITWLVNINIYYH